MSNEIKTGGPAFPYSSLAPDNVAGGMSPTMYADCTGMTLRDYFIAHAPAEPQPWFQPVMPAECPPTVLMNEERTTTYANAIDAERECGDCFINVNEKTQAAWKAERNKQRYVQWAAAWADAMLAVREQQ